MALKGGEIAEGVAAYVAEHFGRLILFEHVVEGAVNIAVSAALAQCRGTGLGDLRGCVDLCLLEAFELGADGLEGSLHGVGGELAGAGKLAGELAEDGSRAVEKSAELVLDEGLALFDYDNGFALVHELADHLLGKRILRHLDYGEGASAGECLHEVVVGKACYEHAETLVSAVGVGVEGRGLADFSSLVEVFDELAVALARVGGHEHPLAGILGI